MAEVTAEVEELRAEVAKKDADLRKVCQALAATETGGQMQHLQDENATLQRQVKTLKDALEITGAPAAPPPPPPPPSPPVPEAPPAETVDADELVALKEQVAALKQQVQEQHAEREASSGKSEELRLQAEKQAEKLKAASRRKAEAQSRLAAVEEELTSKAAAVDALSAEVATAREEAETATAALQDTAQELTEQRERADGLETRATKLAEEQVSLSDTCEGLTATMDDFRGRAQRAEARLEATQTALEGAQEEQTEQALQSKIGAKRSAHLIRDLKAQLAKECEGSKALMAKVAGLEQTCEAAEEGCAAAEAARAEAAQRAGSLEVALKEEQQRKAHPLAAGLSLVRKKKATSHFPPQQPPPQQPPRQGGQAGKAGKAGVEHGGHGGQDADGVKLALAKRLESLLGENQSLKEKVAFLESSMQSYASEVMLLKQAAGAVNAPPQAKAKANARANAEANAPKAKSLATLDDTEVDL